MRLNRYTVLLYASWTGVLSDQESLFGVGPSFAGAGSSMVELQTPASVFFAMTFDRHPSQRVYSMMGALTSSVGQEKEHGTLTMTASW